MSHRSNSIATPSLCMFFWQQCFPACTVNYCFSFFSYEINLSSTKWTSSYRKSLHPCTFSIKKKIIAPYFLLPVKSLWLIPPSTKKTTTWQLVANCLYIGVLLFFPHFAAVCRKYGDASLVVVCRVSCSRQDIISRESPSRSWRINPGKPLVCWAINLAWDCQRARRHIQPHWGSQKRWEVLQCCQVARTERGRLPSVICVK